MLFEEYLKYLKSAILLFVLSRAGATFLPLRYDSQSVEQAGAGLFLKTATIRGAYSGTRDPGSEYVSEIAFSKETLFQLERTGVNPEILRMLLRFLLLFM